MILDRYRTPFRLLMPGNTDQYRTVLGTIFTILTLLLVMSYGSYKFQVLLDYQDYKLKEEIQQEFYEPMEPFTFDDGFAVAAGVIDYGS